ncbi:MAG: hypothetical protein KDC38_10700 [Planctomycetes bacterium]|nr:hypothetical protein [Planctomycetota bacterium]
MLQRIRNAKYSATQTLGLLVAMALGVTFVVHAGALIVPHTFVPGDTARANEVNENFAMLSNTIAQLQSDLAALQTQVDTFGQFITIDNNAINGLAGPHFIIEGANVHIRSGSGFTDDGGTPSGLGNLVIGYDEESSSAAADDRLGAHNIVLGRGNKFTSFGGVVAGEENTISGPFASVLGGANSVASGLRSTISGGAFHQASGEESSVSGGVSNFATAQRSSASGGAQNTVSGIAASITGGSGGAAGGFASSISGGQGGIASGNQSSVCGGTNGSAFGVASTIGGGFGQSVTNNNDWRACDLTCP